jgi:hypothetical protein
MSRCVQTFDWYCMFVQENIENHINLPTYQVSGQIKSTPMSPSIWSVVSIDWPLLRITDHWVLGRSFPHTFPIADEQRKHNYAMLPSGGKIM